MLQDKRGISEHMLWVIIGISISLVVFIPMIGFAQSQLNGILDLTETNLCRSTLKLQGKLDQVSPVSIQNNCQTLGPIDLPVKARRTNDLLREFSDVIAMTWHMSANGEVRDMWDGGGFVGFAGQECLVMYLINFEAKNGFTEPIPAASLERFFSEEQMDLRKPGENANWKYAEYISSSGGPGRWYIMPTKASLTGDVGDSLIDSQNIFPGQDYAVSIVSPYSGLFGGSSTSDTNVVMFSSLDFATQEIGCSIRKGAAS